MILSSCFLFLPLFTSLAWSLNVTLTTADVATSVQKGVSGQAVWRLQFTVPTFANSVFLTFAQLKTGGTLPVGGVTKVDLYRSSDGTFGSGDTSLASGFLNGAGEVTLNGFSMQVFEGLDGGSYVDRWAFVVVDVAETALVTENLRLTMSASTWVKFSGSEVSGAGTFPQASGAIGFTNNPDQVTVTSTSQLTDTIFQGRQGAVMALTLATGVNQGGLVLTALAFSLTSDPGVGGVHLYRETGGAGWSATSDTLVKTVASPFTQNRGSLTALVQTLASSGGTFYLAVSLKSDAMIGGTFQMTLLNNAFLQVASPDTVNDFTAGSVLITVAEGIPPVVFMTAGVVAPPYLTQGIGTGDDPYERAAFLRLTLQTDAGQAVWGGLKVSLTGDLDSYFHYPFEWTQVYLYRDDNADGTWQATETSLAWYSDEAYYNDNSVFTKTLQLTGFAETVTVTPSRYFIVGGVCGARAGLRIGFDVPNAQPVSLVGEGTVSASAFPLSSGVATTIADRPDQLYLYDAVSPIAPSQDWLPGKERVLLTWKMRVTNIGQENEKAVWTSMRFLLTGNLPLDELVEIRLYRAHENHSGILQNSSSFEISLGSWTSFGQDPWITLSNLNFTLLSSPNLYTVGVPNHQRFLVTVRTKDTTSPVPLMTLGVGAVQPSDFGVAPVDTSTMAWDAIPAITLQSWLRLTLSGASQAPLSMTQVEPQVDGWRPLLRLSFNADRPVAMTLKKLEGRVSAPSGASLTLQLWKAGATSTGQWDPAMDTSLWNLPLNGIPVGGGRNFSWDWNGPNYLSLNSDPNDPRAALFLVAKLAPNSPPGQIAFTLKAFDQFSMGGPTSLSFVANGAWDTGGITVIDTPDKLTLSAAGFGDSSEVTSGYFRRGTARVVHRIKLDVDQDTVVITTMKVQVIGDIPYGQVRVSGPWGSTQIGQDKTVTSTAAIAVTHQVGGSTYLRLTMEVSPEASLGSTVGLSVVTSGPDAVKVGPPDAVVFAPGAGTPALLTLIAYDADVANLAGNDDGLPREIIPSGVSPVVNMTAWTSLVGGEGQARWTGLKVSLFSSRIDQKGRVAVLLYRDTQHNGQWDQLGDSLIALAQGTVDQSEVLLSGFSETLGLTPGGYFLALSLNNVEQSVNLGATPVGWSVEAPDVAAPPAIAPLSPVSVVPPEFVSVGVLYVAPLNLTQGEEATFLNLTLATTGASNLFQLKVSLMAPPGGVSGKATVYWDQDGSGEYSGAGDDLDTNRAFTFFNASGGSWLTLAFGGDRLDSGQSYLYFLRLSLDALTPVNGGVGVVVTGPDDLKVFMPDQVTATLPFPIQSGLGISAMVQDKPDLVRIFGFSKAANSGFQRPLTPLPILQFTMKADSDRAVLTQVTVTLKIEKEGYQVNENLGWVQSVMLYRYGGESLGGVDVVSSADLILTNLSVTIDSNPLMYQLRLLPSLSAPVNTTFGVSVYGVDALTLFKVADPDTLAQNNGTYEQWVFPSAVRLSDFASVNSWTAVPAPEGVVRKGWPSAFLIISLAAPGSATLTALKFSLLGTATPSDLASVKLYQDTANPFSQFTSDDTEVGATTALDGNRGTLSGMTAPIPGRYFLVATPASGAATGRTVGITLAGASDFTVAGVDVFTSPSGGVGSTLATIIPVNAALVKTEWTVLAPNQTYSQTPTAVLGMRWFTDQFDARLTAFKLTFTGTINSLVHLTASLYRDLAPFGSTLIATAQFGADREGTFSGLSETLIVNSKNYFLKLEAGPNANSGATLGVGVPVSSYLSLDAPDLPAPAYVPPLNQTLLLVGNPIVTADVAVAEGLTDITLGIAQSALKVTLRTTQGTATVNRVGLSLFGTAIDSGWANYFDWDSPSFMADRVLTMTVNWPAGTTPSVHSINIKPRAPSGISGGTRLMAGKTIGAAILGIDALGAGPPYLVQNGSTVFPVVSHTATIRVVPKTQGYITNASTLVSGGGLLRPGGEVVMEVIMSTLGLGNNAPPQPPVVLSAMALSLQTDWNPSQFATVLYKDTNLDGMWQTNDDESLTAGTFGTNGLLTLAGPGWPMSFLWTTFNPNLVDRFFLVFRAFGDGPPGPVTIRKKFAFPQGGNFGWLQWVAPDWNNPNNNTTNFLGVTVLAADADVVTGEAAPASPMLTWSGTEAPWLGMTLATDGWSVPMGGGGTAQLTEIAVQMLTGAGSVGSQFIRLALYEDRGAPGWHSGEDASLAGLAQFDPNGVGTFTGFTSTFGPTGLTYFITGKVIAGGLFGTPTGVSVLNNSVKIAGPDYLQQLTYQPTYPIPSLGAFYVTLSGGSMNGETIAPGTESTMMWLNLNTNGGEALFNRLTLSLLGSIQSSDGEWYLYDGLTRVTGTVFNHAVTFAVLSWPLSLTLSKNVIKVLSSAITSTELLKITLDSTDEFPEEGSLRIESEDIRYSEKTTVTITGVTRGVNGTTAEGHPAGVSVFLLPLPFRVSLTLFAQATPLASVGVRFEPGMMNPVEVAQASLAPLPVIPERWSTIYLNPTVAGEVSVSGGPDPAAVEITQGHPNYRPTLLNLTFSSTNPSLKMTRVKLSLTGSDIPVHGSWTLAGALGVVDDYRTVAFNVTLSSTGVYPIQFQPAATLPVGTPIGITLLPVASNLTVDWPGVILPFSGIGTSLYAVKDYGDGLTGGGGNLSPDRLRPGEERAFLTVTLAAAADPNHEDTVWSALKVSLTGTLNPAWVAGVNLYRDDPPDGAWNASDPLLGSGTYASSLGLASLDGWAETLAFGSFKRYFVALSLSPSASGEGGRTVGAILGGNNFTADGLGWSLAQAVSSNLTAVFTGGVLVDAEDVAPVGVAPGAIQPVYRISLRMDAGQSATLTAMTLRYTGNLDPDRFTWYLARDDAPANGRWDATYTLMGTLAGWAAYGSMRDGVMAGLTETLSAFPRTFFIALSLDPSAPETSTVGVSLVRPFAVLAPAVIEPYVGGSRLVVVDGPDELSVKGSASALTMISQRQNVVAFLLTLNTNQDTAISRSLRLSLAGTLSPSLAGVQLGSGVSPNVQPIRDTNQVILGYRDVSLVSSFTAFADDRWASLTFDRTISPTVEVYRVELVIATLATIGETVGLALTGAGAWGVEAPDTVVMTPAALATPVLPVADGPDGLSMTGSDIGPPFAVLGVEQAFLRLSLVTDDELVWRSLYLTLGGTAPPDLVTARLYRDANGSGAWEAEGDSLLGATVFSAGRGGTFSNLGETITSTSPRYLVTLSLNSESAVGLTIGVKVYSYYPNLGWVPFTVDPPDFGQTGGEAFAGPRGIIQPEIIAIEAQSLASSVLLSGASSALMRLILQPSQGGFATWAQLRLSVTGSAPADDVRFNLYRDDGNGMWNEGGETLLKTVRVGGSRSGLFSALNQIIDRPIIYYLALTHIGSVMHQTVGVTINSDGFSFGDGGVPMAGFKAGSPLMFVKQPAEVTAEFRSLGPLTLAQGSAPQPILELTMKTDQDLAVWRALVLSLGPTPAGPGLRVRLYRESDAPEASWDVLDQSLAGVEASAGPWLTLSGFDQTLTSASRRYYVVGAPSVDGPWGAFRWTLATAWGEWSLAQSVRAGGAGAEWVVEDSPDRVTLTAADAGVATHRQNAERVYAALTLSVDQDAVIPSTLRVAWHPQGTLDPASVGLLRWYRDANGNGEWDPADDRLLASARFEDGAARLAPTGLTVSGSGLITFLTVQLSLGAPAQKTLGLSLGPDPLAVAGADGVSAFAGFASALKTVVVGVPLTLGIFSRDLGLTAPQGTLRLTLMSLTLANGSAIGDLTAIERLTFGVGPVIADLTALWVESLGMTLGESSEIGPVRTISLAPAQISGAPVWSVMGAIHPIASLGVLRVTLTGVVVSPPDVAPAFGLSHGGSVGVTDGPDTVALAGGSESATRILMGEAPIPLLRVTASISSLPKDSAVIQGLVVSLNGAPPTGGMESAYQGGFSAFLYKESGDGTFDLADDTLMASASFVNRLATLAFETTISGSLMNRWWVALSLKATAPLPHVYGGTAGLSLAGLQLAGVDVAEFSGELGTQPAPIFDRVPHLFRGMDEGASLALTLGAPQALFRLTLATDRDEVKLRSLILTIRSLFEAVSADDLSGVKLYRETGGGEGWNAADDAMLGTALLVDGRISLWAGTGVRVGTAGVTLWVAGRVNPFFNPNNFLTVEVAEQYERLVTVTPATLSVSGFYGLDAATTLAVGGADFIPPVVLTGETVPVMRISLNTSGGGVGVTRVGVRLNALNVETLAPHVTFELFEGSRRLAVGGVQSAETDVLRVTFGVREPVYEEQTKWDVYLTVSETAPNKEFYIGFDPSSVTVAGGANDVVAGQTLNTAATRVVSSWGYAVIQVSRLDSPIPPGGAPVTRESQAPLVRMLLKTVGSNSLARLTAFRGVRLGRGYDADAKLAVYLGAVADTGFDPGAAVKIGTGVFRDRAVAVTLTSRPFLTGEPRALWLVAEVASTAALGATWGLEFDARGLVGQGAYDVQGDHLPYRSALLTIVDSRPSSIMVAVTGTGSGSVAQGASLTLGILTAQLESGSGSMLTGMKWSLVSGGATPARFRLLNASGENIVRGQSRESGVLWLTLDQPVNESSSSYAFVADVPTLAAVGTTLQVEAGADGLWGPTLDTRTWNGGQAWRSPAWAIRDAPDTLTLSARPRPVPWEVGDWTPMFLITFSVNQDEASLIRITLLSSGNLGISDLGIDAFRLRMGTTVTPVTVSSLGDGVFVLSLSNSQLTRFPNSQIGTLELSLSPSINLTGTLGLSLLGVGLAPDPVTGQVADTVVFSPVGTSLLGIRNPSQPFPPALVVNARYVKGLGAFGATWGATVKQGTVSAYRYVVLSWKGTRPDFEALTLSLASDPWSLPLAWEALTAWTPTEAPRLLETGLQLAHGMTLYVAVQAKTPNGPWSEVAFSDAIMVDSAKPQFSAHPPEAVKGKKQMVLTWNAPASGPSGVDRYVVERRRGTKPTWEVLVSAQAPRIDPSPIQKEEWGLWYPSSHGHLLTGESPNLLTGKSGNLLIGTAPALQFPTYQIPKLLNGPIETKLTPYLTSTSSVLPLEDGTSYYRVKAVSGAGEESEPTATTKVVAGVENLPNLINEVSNYPNPFDSRVKTTTLVYVLNQDAKVTVSVVTALGDLVKEWVFAPGEAGGSAGANEVAWDGANSLGVKVATGAYITVIKAHANDGKSHQVIRKIGLRH